MPRSHQLTLPSPSTIMGRLPNCGVTFVQVQPIAALAVVAAFSFKAHTKRRSKLTQRERREEDKDPDDDLTVY
jgi:hypothetical protein